MRVTEARAMMEARHDKGCRDTFIKCVPGASGVLGIRSADMKAIAKTIAAGDWHGFLTDPEPMVYAEELSLKGLVIGSLKEKFEVVEPLLREFVPKLDSWASCDTLCASLKMTKKNMEPMLALVKEYLHSEREYELRFAIVMLLCYYIDEEHIDYVLSSYDSVHREEYYIRMAVAWGLSVCFVKQRDKTLAYMSDPNSLDKWTFNKAIQKCTESFRVSAEDKALLRSMRWK